MGPVQFGGVGFELPGVVPQACDHAVEGIGQNAHFVLGVHGRVDVEVVRVNLLHGGHQYAQGSGDPADAQEAEGHGYQQDQQGDEQHLKPEVRQLLPDEGIGEPETQGAGPAFEDGPGKIQIAVPPGGADEEMTAFGGWARRVDGQEIHGERLPERVGQDLAVPGDE